MFGWLYNRLLGKAGKIPAKLASELYAPLHVIYSLVHTVFVHVGGAWGDAWGALHTWTHYLGEGLQWTLRFGERLVTVDLPTLFRAAEEALGRAVSALQSLITSVQRWAVGEFGVLTRAVAGIIPWVRTHLVNPILARLEAAEQRIVAWAFVAWRYVTHPADLAALLLGPLLDLAERTWPALARRFGTFVASVVLHQMTTLAAVVESIIADVL